MNEPASNDYFPLGLLLSAKAWQKHNLSELFRNVPGDESARLDLVRHLAHRITSAKAAGEIETPIYAGQLNGMALLLDVLRYLVDQYCRDEQRTLKKGLNRVSRQLGREEVEIPIRRFVEHFPPGEVVLHNKPRNEYIHEKRAQSPREHLIPREILLLALSTANPALEPLRPLFEDSELRAAPSYLRLVHHLEDFFNQAPPLGELGETLFSALRAPVRASPDNLEGQIDYILRNWKEILPEDLYRRLLLARDVLREEEKLRLQGPAPPQVLRFDLSAGDAGEELEEERFSPDSGWMENLVLLAKSVYVWLHQLSRAYGRPIRRLDEIPDEELDRLAMWGITGLWLIGVWERSPASQKIKRLTGNPEALSSAYSIYDYVIAEDLGGPAALESLSDRAQARGIRLASDMVPNHMGVYSRWVVEHPDRFIQVDHPPFPNYRFTGPDLSEDERVGIFIEDGYWDHRDAAVVFKRLDRRTGEEKYLYHGNDGTHMPWNDTAQLDYLKPEVREEVIQTILHVARQFPVIRFDAAMTLTKRHYQRLWYPPPGEGGDIPSRAERGMPKEEFDRKMPREFWREVVDRVAREAPDTLLLAEAFWLMEGYFVRTLGMHRVYNSAFMNMLKMEENAQYRTTIKNVLEFCPEILKRFVNFMNNPDEETAIAQFGDGDKYFGVAVLLVTMPGLPMLGHGQIEGFTEKYGMEYPRAYHDEIPRQDLVRRHEAEIFPLMRKRYLFSGSRHFSFYDFVTPTGTVDENVFAYSNRTDKERALVIYNNAYGTTKGTIRLSTPFNTGTQETGNLVQRSLTESLDLKTGPGFFYVTRDFHRGLEYLFSADRLEWEGLTLELRGYQYTVFLDFRETYDLDGTWAELDRRLNGKGVPDIEKAHKEVVLEPLLIPFRNWVKPERVRSLTDSVLSRNFEEAPTDVFGKDLEDLLSSSSAQGLHPVSKDEIQREIVSRLELLGRLEKTDRDQWLPEEITDYLTKTPPEWSSRIHFVQFSVLRCLVQPLESIFRPSKPEESWLDSWLLLPQLENVCRDLSGDSSAARDSAVLLKAVLTHAGRVFGVRWEDGFSAFTEMFADTETRDFLGVNLHDGILWFNKERWEQLLHALFHAATMELQADRSRKPEERSSRIEQSFENLHKVLEAAEKSGYRLERTLDLMQAFLGSS